MAVFVVFLHRSYYRHFTSLTIVEMWSGETKKQTFNAEKPPKKAVFLRKVVRVTGFEPAASCSQSRRATNCATPGYSVYLSGWSYSPKPGAIPTSLYPDIQFLSLYHGGGEKQRFFCLWSFLWSKPLLRRFRQSMKTPQTQASQGFAAFHLTLSRIPPRHSQTRRDTSFAIPGYSASAIIPRRGEKSKAFSRCGHLCAVGLQYILDN